VTEKKGYTHSNAHKPPKPVTATVFMLDKKLTEMYWSSIPID